MKRPLAVNSEHDYGPTRSCDSTSASGSDSDSGTSGGCASMCFFSPLRPSGRRATKPKKNSTDDGELLLAKEMRDLSVHERENVYDDIHGVAKPLEEAQIDLEALLEQFDSELTAVRKKVGYDRAVFACPKYVRDVGFRLMFLRADNYQVSKAVRRIINHFDEKFKLFGYNRVGKKIRWTDLDQDDRDSVSTGATQLFTKDTTGRGLFFNTYAYRRDKTTANHLRAMWYTFMSAVQDDDEIQRKGVVIVAYTLGTTIKNFFRSTGMSKQQDFEKVLPFRVAAIQICVGDLTFKPIVSTFMAAHPQPNRLRVRVHFGSHVEIQYALNSYGITQQTLPFESDGVLKPGLFDRRLRELHDQEHAEEEAHARVLGDLTPYPLEHDVVLGRGSPYQKFPGNVQLQHLVEASKPDHDRASSRVAKTAISVNVVKKMQQLHNTRFLKRDKSEIGWYVVDDDIAREKVAMGFRNLARKGRTN